MVKCTQCNRQFKTKAAMEQHRRDVHSKGSQSTPQVKAPRAKKNGNRNGPMRSPIAASTNNNDIRMRVRRLEYVATCTLEAKAANASGFNVFDPTTSCATLAKLSKTFLMYKVHKMTLVYKTLSSTMRDGNAILSFDYDASVSVSVTKTSALAMANISVPLYEKERRLNVPLDNQPRYLTKRDERDRPVCFYWLGTSTSTAKVDLFDVFLDYDIELYGLNPI